MFSSCILPHPLSYVLNRCVNTYYPKEAIGFHLLTWPLSLSDWWWHCVLSYNPYLWIREPGEVWVQIELDAFRGTWQCDTSDQEDQQHDVREGGSDIHDLPRRREKRVRQEWEWWAYFSQHSSLSKLLHAADCPLGMLPWTWLDAWTMFSVSIYTAQAQKDSWFWASTGFCFHSCQ